jgi:hypothetical protein
MERDDGQGATGPPRLPAWKAFVVQFDVETAHLSRGCAGRVEHLSSGRRARFGSRDELFAALERMLDELGEAPE